MPEFRPSVLLVCPTCGDVVGDSPDATPNPDYVVTSVGGRIPAAPDDKPCINCWEAES